LRPFTLCNASRLALQCPPHVFFDRVNGTAASSRSAAASRLGLSLRTARTTGKPMHRRHEGPQDRQDAQTARRPQAANGSQQAGAAASEPQSPPPT
jgi:hypothetical protein